MNVRFLKKYLTWQYFNSVRTLAQNILYFFINRAHLQKRLGSIYLSQP